MKVSESLDLGNFERIRVNDAYAPPPPSQAQRGYVPPKPPRDPAKKGYVPPPPPPRPAPPPVKKKK